MGRPVATTLRAFDQMAAIIDGNPFSKVSTKPAHLWVTFLSHAPTKAEVAALYAQNWTPELFVIVGKRRSALFSPQRPATESVGNDTREAALAPRGHERATGTQAEARGVAR
jgi:uncharacterized protein (DUF1697 family)